MLYALIILAIGILLFTAMPRPARCNHEFVPADSFDFGTHRELVYKCEKCGVQLEGQI